MIIHTGNGPSISCMVYPTLASSYRAEPPLERIAAGQTLCLLKSQPYDNVLRQSDESASVWPYKKYLYKSKET
jgi:hypothetical protein